MTAYYNENDPYAAQWLRNLIAAGHIAPGYVDERSIADVQAGELSRFLQCHFFAGIGGWSFALRLAGWPDERRVWTGSCPCQPLSSAGKRKGHADERHLWPAFHDLIAQRRPAIVFGEQVASADGREWLAAVRADLEALGYACGAAGLCAAGVGASHIRQRLWWVADAASERRQGRLAGPEEAHHGVGRPEVIFDRSVEIGVLAKPAGAGRGTQPQRPSRENGRQAPELGRLRDAGGLDDAAGPGPFPGAHSGIPRKEASAAQQCGRDGGRSAGSSRAGGFWADAEWLPCLDGKARPVEPGTFPLANGVSDRVAKLRALGNAIVPQVAAEFVTAFMECRP